MGRLKRSHKQPALRPSANDLTTTTDSRGEPSPGLTANLPSNNPFRNRAASPANSLPSPVTTSFNNIPNTAPERPISRNPFLDQSDKKNGTTIQVRQTSPETASSTMAGRSSPRKPALTGHGVELFVSRPLLISIKLESVDADSTPPRTTSLSTMGLQPTARYQKACLHHIPIAHHAQKTTPPSLPTAYRDIIHHGHRKMGSIGRTRGEDLKGRSWTSLPIHPTRQDHADVQPDETRIHQSPASS